jgi:competence protein ComEA
MFIAWFIFSVMILSPAEFFVAARPVIKTQDAVSIKPGFAASNRASTNAHAQAQNEERININTASTEELERLPGIGPTLASRIVEHRRRHGRFKRPQDIIIVRGVSAKLYRRIAHLVRI